MKKKLKQRKNQNTGFMQTLYKYGSSDWNDIITNQEKSPKSEMEKEVER